MARRCERPSCGEVATVAYGFDTERSLVVLEAFADADADSVRAGVLCRRHADALSAPRGWWVDDRRQASPMLFSAETGRSEAATVTGASGKPEPARSRAAKRSRRPRDADRSLFDIDDAIEDALEFAATPARRRSTQADGDVVASPVHPSPVDPDETKAIEWSPVFDQADDLGGLLKARSPLLSRAFGLERRTLKRS